MQMCYLDYSRTSAQPWDRRKWPLCRGGHYKEVGVLYDNFFREYNMFFFVLSSCLLYPIIVVIKSYMLYRDKIHKKLELCHESKC